MLELLLWLGAFFPADEFKCGLSNGITLIVFQTKVCMPTLLYMLEYAMCAPKEASAG